MGFLWTQDISESKKSSETTLVIQATELSPFVILHKIGDFKFTCSTIFRAPVKQYNIEMR